MADKVKIRSEHNAAGLTNVAKVVMPLAKQLLGGRGYLLIDLLGQWQIIAGKEIARCALPLKLAFAKNSQSNGILTVAVCSGAAALELKQRQNILIAKINAFFGYDAVGSLKIMQTANPADFVQNKKPIENLQKKVVSADKENYITDLIKDIKSPELREVLRLLGHNIENEPKKQGRK